MQTEPHASAPPRPRQRRRSASHRWRSAASLVACALHGVAAHAEPSVPWAPSAAGRHAIELLVDDAGLDLTTTQWPLPRSAVARAIDALPSELPPALDAARARVKRELRAEEGSLGTVTIRSRAEVLAGFGDDATPGSALALRSPTYAAPNLAMQFGARVDVRANAAASGTRLRLDDSAVATEAFGVQLQAWAHRAWWGPGWQSALALSNNAPALMGVGLQRASASQSDSKWLAWLGPWNAELFVAQTEGVNSPPHPLLIGNRVTLRPFPQVEIGLTRMVQWGGGGRDNSLRSFFYALTSLHSNPDNPTEQRLDPGNSLAGFDLRVRCPSSWGCAGYAQLIGEDKANYIPTKYLGVMGLAFWPADASQRFFTEYAETGCHAAFFRPAILQCAYYNYAYLQGYASAGRWLGASLGPDSRVLTLGWLDAANDSALKLHVGRVGWRIGSFSPTPDDPASAGRLIGVSAQHGFALGRATLTPQVSWQRVATKDGARTQASMGATLSMNLDAEIDRGSEWLGASLSGGSGAALKPVLLGLGLIAGSALFDKRADDYAARHGNGPSAKVLRRTGDWLPVAGLGLAGLSWATQHGSPQGDVGFAAVTAGLGAVAMAEGIKVAVDRARPTDGLGTASFGQTRRQQSAFPSLHATLAWAVVTPYAEHFDAPWLYGVAALTNAARVGGRRHWLSDTVAGAVFGYAVGDYAYRRSRTAADRSPGARLWVTPQSVVLDVPFE